MPVCPSVCLHVGRSGCLSVGLSLGRSKYQVSIPFPPLLRSVVHAQRIWAQYDNNNYCYVNNDYCYCCYDNRVKGAAGQGECQGGVEEQKQADAARGGLQAGAAERGGNILLVGYPMYQVPDEAFFCV